VRGGGSGSAQAGESWRGRRAAPCSGGWLGGCRASRRRFLLRGATRSNYATTQERCAAAWHGSGVHKRRRTSCTAQKVHPIVSPDGGGQETIFQLVHVRAALEDQASMSSQAMAINTPFERIRSARQCQRAARPPAQRTMHAHGRSERFRRRRTVLSRLCGPIRTQSRKGLALICLRWRSHTASPLGGGCPPRRKDAKLKRAVSAVTVVPNQIPNINNSRRGRRHGHGPDVPTPTYRVGV